MAVGCFVSVGRSLDAAVERVKLAEELGYEAAYLTHIAGREPFIVLTAYALATSASGSAPASHRSTRGRRPTWRRRRRRSTSSAAGG